MDEQTPVAPLKSFFKEISENMETFWHFFW